MTEVGGEARAHRAPGLLLVSLSLCGIVVSLQQTLVVPLLPELPRLMGTSPETASWMVTASILSGAVATPGMSRLADMYGKRRIMLVAVWALTFGSLLGAVCDSVLLTLTARALQGVGVTLVPVGIAVMRDHLPVRQIPFGVALMSACLSVGGLIGMVVAGLIASHLDWRAIFWIIWVAGVAMIVVIRLLVPESEVRTGGSFDYVGAVLLSAALLMLLLVLSKGQQWGWDTSLTLSLAAGGSLLLLVWVPHQLKAARPLVDLRIATRPAMLGMNVASMLLGFALFANMLVTLQQLQMPETLAQGHGLSVMEAGLWMIPGSIVGVLMSPVAALMVQRWGARDVLVLASGVAAVSFGVRLLFHQELWQVLAGMTVCGVALSVCYAALPSFIMKAVPRHETASANGLNALLRSIGHSMATASLAALISFSGVSVAANVYPTTAAINLMFAAALITSAIATVLMWSAPSDRESVLARGDAMALDRSSVPSMAGVRGRPTGDRTHDRPTKE